MNPFSYQAYELTYLAVAPARAISNAASFWAKNPLNPLAKTYIGRSVAASSAMFERMTRRYGKPQFGFSETTIGGRTVAVEEEIVWQKPFCRVIRFKRDSSRTTPCSRAC